MADPVMAAAFQHIECADHVAIDVTMRIPQRVAHARLRAQMHHSVELLACEQRRDLCSIAEIEALETVLGKPLESLETRHLEIHIVIVIEVVESDDLIAAIEKARRDERTDESGRTSDEDLHAHPPQTS